MWPRFRSSARLWPATFSTPPCSSEDSRGRSTVSPFSVRPRPAERAEGLKPETMRIVSLLPSATEIVCLLGLQDSLVGVSHECDFPPSVRRLPRVVRSSFDPAALSQSEIDERVRAAMRAGGSGCEVDEEALASLAPDLVITQELCDVCAVPQAAAAAAVEKLAPSPRLLSLHPHSLGDVLGDIRR